MIRPEFLNLKNAAAYCGYGARHFARVTDGYQLPKYGPKLNRYKISDLEDFMASPSDFAVRAERRRTGFIPVEV